MQPRIAEPDPDASPGRPKAIGLTTGLFYAIAVVGLAISGAYSLRARQGGTEVEFVLSGQAGHLARSGIGEAVNWFRVQPAQPVLTFEPRRDATTSPPLAETEEPEVGLVREFQIDGPYWGRYEVWKSWDGDPVPERRAWRDKMQVRDTSARRGLPPGSVWKITCTGYVFERLDPRKSFRRYPNRVVSSQVLEAEIGRVILNPSGGSALSVRDGAGVTLRAASRVSGGSGVAITYPQASSAPTVDSLAELDGRQILAPVPTYDDSLLAVFGTDEVGLRAMADMVIGSERELPSEIPAGSIVFSHCGAVTLDRPLSGSGVLVHQGDLKLAPGSDFTGLLYVDGSLQVPAPAEITGTVIATGEVILGGSQGSVILRYDPSVIAGLRHELGQYRLAGPLRSTHSTE